jgi:hypothetical protein
LLRVLVSSLFHHPPLSDLAHRLRRVGTHTSEQVSNRPGLTDLFFIAVCISFCHP